MQINMCISIIIIINSITITITITIFIIINDPYDIISVRSSLIT
jgi:hypothetical protein